MKTKMSNYRKCFALAYVLSALVLFTSCEPITSKKFTSSKLELRQLIQQTETQKVTHGYYFIIAGGFDSYENKITTVKVFAKVEGRFRLIEMQIEDVRIAIDNKLKTPNIEIEYTSNIEESDEELLNGYYSNKVYVINCPEQYLPEKLLPIGL